MKQDSKVSFPQPALNQFFRNLGFLWFIKVFALLLAFACNIKNGKGGCNLDANIAAPEIPTKAHGNVLSLLGVT